MNFFFYKMCCNLQGNRQELVNNWRTLLPGRYFWEQPVYDMDNGKRQKLLNSAAVNNRISVGEIGHKTTV